MAKMVQVQRTETPVNMKKTKNGKIQKKNSETFSGIPIEKKNYKISQLSALEGTYIAFLFRKFPYGQRIRDLFPSLKGI